MTRKNEITHPLCVFFLQKIHKICTGQNKIVPLEKILFQRLNYEKMNLDYEGRNRNVFPFFREAETSVSSFCLILLFILQGDTRTRHVQARENVFELYNRKLRQSRDSSSSLYLSILPKKSMTAFLKISLVR